MHSTIMCRSNEVRNLLLFLYSGLFWGHGTFCVYLSVNRAAGSIGHVDSFPQFFFLFFLPFFSSLARRWHPKLLSLNQTDWSGVWRGQWPPSDVQPGICEGTDLTFFWGAGIWPQHSCFTPSPSHLLPSLKTFCVWSFSSSWSMLLSSLDSRLEHTHALKHLKQTQLFEELLPDIGGHHLSLLRKRMLCLCKSCLTIKQDFQV